MAVRKVGSSRILREIGRGGMGVVYEAYQEGLDRRVAVKSLELKPGARSKEQLERFRREGRAYAQLRHAAIVAVHDLVEKDETLYLVTEFVDGSDLGRILDAGGPFPPACVAAVGARLADALDHVHLHGLLHRDVKPANVMVSRRGEVKLMDFGILKDPMATELTQAGGVMGTPCYVAPEVLEGTPASEQSDLWSLGVTLYELAAGVRPFGGADFNELFAAVRKGRLRPLRELAPGVPKALARAVERCLERRPGRRWESAGLLARDLEDLARSLCGADRPEERLQALLDARGLGDPEGGAATGTRTARARARRRLWPWLVAAAAAAAAGAGLVWLRAFWR